MPRRFALLLLLCAVPVSAQVAITVDAAQNRHAIDPRIYGVAFADAASIADLTLPLNRWGGNTTSRYNWINCTSNHARDWYFQNIPDNEGQPCANGLSADQFIQQGSQAIITLPVLGLLPNARARGCSYEVGFYTAQGCCDTFSPDNNHECGDGFHTGNPLKGINNPLDVAAVYPSSHQGDWITHNVNTFGAGGVKYYAIDNEPGLWDSTHFDIHPNPSTYDEIWGKTQEYGAVVKTRDALSRVVAFEEWGWLGYFDSTADWNASPPVTTDRTNHGGVPLAEWLLQQARAYEQTHGTRIVDVFTVHWYPQGKKNTSLNEYDPNNPAQEVQTATKLLRNQSTRSLWDPTYVEQSWIQDVPAPGEASSIAQLIPRMRGWVNRNYPGTEIGITEYSWGDGNNGAGVGAQVDANGATAQADVLGIFGREGLDVATRWTSPPAGTNVYNAIKMYRNYDGAHAMFGDISVSGSSPVPDTVATFAALRSGDRALTIMVINKDLANAQQVTINLANYNRTGNNATAYQLTTANTITGPTTISGNPIIFSAPPETITILVVPGGYLDAPTGVIATATGTTTANIRWNAVAGAASYTVQRSATLGGAVTTLCPATMLLNCNDNGLAADTTYLYRVVANSATASSGPSQIDPATTTMFTDPTLTPGIPIRSAHITELRTAVNAMRFAANLAPQTFTDPALNGVVAKAIHIRELRQALDQARAALGIPLLPYTDMAVLPSATTIKAAHIVDLRTAVQ